jgi:hypothetical protein
VSTLVEVINKLKEQDTSLTEIKTNTSESSKGIGDIAVSTKDTNKGIQRLVEYFTGGDALERERDAQRKEKGVTRPEGRSSGTNVGSNTAGGSRAQDLMNMAALNTAGFTLSSAAAGILKRTIPGLLITAFADEIGDYVASQTGSAELGATAERAVAGAGIGTFLFGKKGGLVGLVLGTLLNEEVRDAAGGLGDSLVERTVTMLNDLDIETPEIKDVEGAISVLQQNVAQGIRGFTKLVRGEMTYDDLKEDWQEMAGILALPLILTGGGRGLALKTLTTGFLALSGWGRFLEYMGSKVPPKIPTAVTTTPNTPGMNAIPDGSKPTQPVPQRNFTVKNGEFFGRDGKPLTGGALTTAKKTYTEDLARQKAVPTKPIDPANSRMKQFLQNSPKLQGALNATMGTGVLSGAIGLYLINDILNSSDPDEVKQRKIASIIESTGGSIVGAAIGSFFGPFGTAAGGIIGGYFGGEITPFNAYDMAGWFMGKLTRKQELDKQIEAMRRATGEQQAIEAYGPSIGSGRDMAFAMMATTPDRGSRSAQTLAPIADENFRFFKSGNQGGASVVDASDNSVTNTSSSSQIITDSGNIHVTDPQDTAARGMQAARSGYGFGMR